MNLTGDPWIPVVFEGEKSKTVSLKDAFARGHEIIDLVATPPQRVALTRLLVCIGQAALDGPADEEDWATCKQRLVPAALAYLDRQRKRFELFGEEAFLQVPNLAAADNATLDKLDFRLAAGNNATLFDHAANADGRERTAAWCAVMLLTYQCFSPGGTIGQTQWGGVTTSRSSEHAPCVDSSMLHTLLRGRRLLDSIHMNLLSKEIIRSLPNTMWGYPVWERMPKSPKDPIAHESTKSYLGRLVPISRGIRLNLQERKATLVNGCVYPKLPYRDPAATVKKKKDGDPVYVRIDLSKHPWRELGSLLALTPGSLEGGPLVTGHLQSADRQATVDVWTGGLATKKAKVLDAAEWTFHLPLSLLGESCLNKYRQGVKLADDGHRRLSTAITGYLEDLGVTVSSGNERKSQQQRKKVLARVGGWYWSQLDGSYERLIDTANSPQASLGGEWYDVVRQAMEQAYNKACPHSNPRQIRAFARGLERLRLRRPESPHER